MALLPGTQIRDLHNPGRTGTITNSPARERPSGRQVQVIWADQTVSYEYEASLELTEAKAFLDPFELIQKGKYGRANDLRRNMTFVHLSGRLANLVYSLGVTNTDFYPHQYRPLLTLLESPTNGILIADEVGLGKTIEAGLIWTEYRARYRSRRLLIVCPAMLREKWRDELQRRFGVHADIVNAANLLDALSNNVSGIRTEQAWIVSYNAIRPRRSKDNDSKRISTTESASESLTKLLADMADHTPLIDMVIFDEAHYMRNRGTAAWRLGDLLKNVSEFQVMLSATPINLRNEDLFSLLQLLDPDHFTSLDDLERLIASNKPLIKARDLVLDLRSTTQDIRRAIEEAIHDPMLADSMQLANILEDLEKPLSTEDRQQRAALADALEKTSLLSHVLTRTRKRDVQKERVQRRVFREAVSMSAAERDVYDLVTTAIRRYSQQNGIGSGFLLSMPQRQVASSPAALIRSWRNDLDSNDDSEYQIEGDREPNGLDNRPLRTFLKNVVLPSVDLEQLERRDSKLDRLVDILNGMFKEDPHTKVIVFTTFRATAQYLLEKLGDNGIQSAIVWGNSRRPKHDVIADFQRSVQQRVLIATEVAAEGVDLQFCSTLINFDLPWNPTRLEQRIGRIDRLGQKSRHISVLNMHFADTVDDRIVTRLLERLDIFREALGETEAVVGEEVSKLEYRLLSRPLTRAEEDVLIDQAAMAIENIARQRDALEKNAAHMMAHGQRVLERLSATQLLKRFITDNDLIIYVQDYLTQYWPGHQFTVSNSDPTKVVLRLPPGLAAKFDDYIKQERLVSQTRLAYGTARTVLFKNNITVPFFDNIEVVHQFHPLISFISSDLKRRQEHYYPLTAVRIDSAELDVIRPGVYVFFAMQWLFAGVRQEEWLSSSLVCIEDGEIFLDDVADIAVQSARVHGQDWLGAEAEVSCELIAQAMEAAETELERQFEYAVKRKRAENLDRTAFQLESVNRHEQRRMATLKEVERNHLSNNRIGLAKATEGQQRVLIDAMAQRRAAISSQAQMECTKRFVCSGILKVH